MIAITPFSKKLLQGIVILILALPDAMFAQIKLTPFHYSQTKDTLLSKAAVVSAHPLASQAGALVMQQGGNAVDAAIATQWALAVVFPGAGNIGGGGFMVARLANGTNLSLDYREKAPGRAKENMYVDSLTGKANTRLSQNGHLSSGVPGTVAGLFESHKYAKLPMAKLIAPAIELAEKGFVITADEANSLNRNRQAFERYNTTLPAFVKTGGEWKAGDTLVQKDLAETLKRIQKLGAKGFYEGETAKLIVNEMERGAGIINLEDLKQYKAVWRKPVEFSYRGHTVLSMPPPSSGGILIHQMLAILEKYPLSQMGFQTAESVQLITEVERRAYADRAEHLGDPDYYTVPSQQLTSPEYLAKRMADYKPGVAGKSDLVKPGLIPESEETTHLSVVDADGNAVAVTTTLNGGYGSKTVVGGAGFLLNNEMDDFSIQPGVPNMYGAIGGKANAIAPGKRMLSSMTPTIVLKDGKPMMVVGTTTIITSVLQSIINVIDYGMNATDAVNKPKFHHQWQPDQIDVEKTFPMDIRKSLEAMGYKINERNEIGRTEMIILKNGKLEAAADKRGDDSVAGW
ncbi:MAG: gamma-glutamyltransferase [Chitinophagaceae bacterium]|nr:gamma-glutamyltransferase [Chitinophagaceae bacterium]